MECRLTVHCGTLNDHLVHIRITLEYGTCYHRLKGKRCLIHPLIRTVIQRISHLQQFCILPRILLRPTILIVYGRGSIPKKLRSKGKLIQNHACCNNVSTPAISSVLLGFKLFRIVGFAVGSDNVHCNVKIILISCHPPHHGLYIGSIGILPVRISYVGMRPVLIGILILLTRNRLFAKCLKCTEPWVIPLMDHLTHQVKIILFGKNARMGKNHLHTLAPVFRGSMRGYLLLRNLRKPVPVNNGIVRRVFFRWLGMYFYPPGLHETAIATARMTVSRRLHAA